MINIQNIDDNECFKWSIAKYLNPENHHQARITKADKDLPKKLDFKDTKFPVKLETSTKVKKRISSALVFVAMRIKENIQSMYQKVLLRQACCFVINRKRHSVLIKDFKTFM